MRRNRLLRSLFLLSAMVVGSTGAWATTYQLTKVTTVKDGGLYVFEQSGHVMSNSVSSKALQTTGTYQTTGLTGTESYVWMLEESTTAERFYMKNASLSTDKYLNNASGKTDMSFGSKSSVWSFSFTDGVALISNPGNSDRFLGYTDETSYVYKAYATSNLSSYDHAITVYELVEEGAATKPTHNVTFSVNGVAGESVAVAEDASITFPANPAAVGGKVFVGWTTTTISGTTNEAPSLVSNATMGTADVTYYAVFAKETDGSGIKTDNLTTSTFGSPSSYTTWSGKSATGGSGAVYAGNSTTNKNGSIQLRDNSNSGIVSTTSGGTVKKVTITWDDTTADNRTLDVYGKNSAYSASSDLFSSKSATKGTLLGSIVYGTSTELEITDEYEYIGMRSNSGAMYIEKISIEWETSGIIYSEYCTSVTVPVSISDAGCATFSSAYATDFSSNETLRVYYINNISGNTATTAEITSKQVPANTGIIIRGSEGNYHAACIATAPAVTGNLLVACVDGYTATYDNEIYILANGTDGVGFYPIAANTTLDAGKAFIGGGDVGAKSLTLSFGEETEISTLDNFTISPFDNAPMYNLAGQRVTKSYKGVVIQNGKKILKK